CELSGCENLGLLAINPHTTSYRTETGAEKTCHERLALGTVANAQDACKATGFDTPTNSDGVNVARGFISDGDFSTSAYLYRPLTARQPSPPVLFSHAEIVISKTKTDLRPMAIKLAEHGATVLVLDRTVMWEPRDGNAIRDPHLPDCGSQWLLSR